VSIFDESPLREGKFGFQRGVGQRVTTSLERREVSEEQKWSYVFNCGFVCAAIPSIKFTREEKVNARGQVEVVCGERPNYKRENHPDEHDHHFVYWCIFILQKLSNSVVLKN